MALLAEHRCLGAAVNSEEKKMGKKNNSLKDFAPEFFNTCYVLYASIAFTASLKYYLYNMSESRNILL